jgi:hypothetical protein
MLEWNEELLSAGGRLFYPRETALKSPLRVGGRKLMRRMLPTCLVWI